MGEEIVFRVIIVGDMGVGKSCILLRFSENTFSEHHVVTLGVDFGTKQMVVDGQAVKLQIWDTAGQESFRSITKSFYRRADGILLVYDATTYSSFKNSGYWLDEIKKNTPQEVVIYLIGNQVDLVGSEDGKRQVTFEEGQNMKESKKLNGFLEISAKTGFNVSETFEAFVRQLLKNRHNQEYATMTLDPHKLKKKKKKCC